MTLHNQKGFTLPELLAAIALFAVLAVITAFILRPASFEHQEHVASRREAVAAMTQLLAAYQIEKGVWPEGITTKPQNIGSEKGQLNLCHQLVPAFAADLPYDPITGIKLDAEEQSFTAASCNTEGISYDASMFVSLSKDGKHITVGTHPVGEFPAISVTR